MSRAAKRAHKNGEPSFKCVRTNLNAAFEIPEPVYIWYMTTVKIKEHLHTIEIVTDAIPIGEEEGEFVQLVPKNKTVMYVNETNPLKPVVRFRHAELPKFGIVGYTLGKKEDTIVDMKFSLSVKDHETLERKKYSMVDEEILADKFTKHALRDQHHMWLRREKDGTGNKSSSVDSLLKKKAEFEKVLEDNPSNERVKQLIAETEEDIKEAEYNERTEQTGNKTQNSVKLLGLKAKELQTITTHFARMDVDQSGTITVKEFFEYIDIEMDEIRQKLFEFLDNSGDGTMDFHELMYALSTFCMFGPKEILQIVFSLADVSTNGDMTLENFKKLLGMIHEVETQDHPDLDRAIKFTESEIGNRIDFDQMYRIHLKYPRCFKPCFDMQFAMMKKFLGMSFWNRKKSIYEQARAALNEAYETEAKELKKMQLKRLQEEHGVETGLARIQKSFRQTARSTLVKTAPILQNTLSKVGVSVKFLEDGESDDESSEEDDDSDEE
uniref:EF-hand domain-containing protein n=1 Tax=Mucochytrium quahogii TaxID=96639 RepID=A0A7S2R9F5_9STRA